jgi:hypothetical protein
MEDYTGITYNWTGNNWQRVTQGEDGELKYTDVSRRAVINSYGSDFNTKKIMDYLGEGPKINNTFNTDPTEIEKEKEEDEKKEEEKKGGFSFFKKQF